MPAPGIYCGFQQIRIVDARYFDGVLEAQENPLTGTLLGFEVQQVLSIIGHGTIGHDVVVVSRDNQCECAFAGAVRSHDGVHFACFRRQR